MPNQSTLLAIVDQIPVDQKARATSDIKRFLLKKVKSIRERRDTIEQAAIQRRREQILDDYKKAIGFDKMKKSMDDLEEKLKKQKERIMQAGLRVNGTLVDISDRQDDSNEGSRVWYEGAYVSISPEVVKKIKGVLKLLKAVEGEMDTFDLFDQLETRMVMASTVGEVMAIFNAAVGVEVFRVNKGALQLEETTQQKGKK